MLKKISKSLIYYPNFLSKNEPCLIKQNELFLDTFVDLFSKRFCSGKGLSLKLSLPPNFLWLLGKLWLLYCPSDLFVKIAIPSFYFENEGSLRKGRLCFLKSR